MILLKNKILNSRNHSISFTSALRIPEHGFKYTINHDVKKYPSAILYGTWSVILLKKLILGKVGDDEENRKLLSILNSYRLANGIFYPRSLDHFKYSKSKEYMYLHCYNYAVGAALEIDNSYDFQSSYMDKFLEADFLERWLDQRSLQRPWEESNNIVNVASYLALCNDYGNPMGKERLYQMLEWHNRIQNPLTGGFEIFRPSPKNILQSMAGAVHNFHIHHYLGEPMRYESKIAQNVIPFLFEGPLTACLSIDFVELACKTITHAENKPELEQALFYHFNALIKYQNPDGGWFENETPLKPTTANGMKEEKASSNSYATWFRMCAIGMIAITLLGDSPERWNFRKTLGMGYSNNKWNKQTLDDIQTNHRIVIKYKTKNAPSIFKKKVIDIAMKIIG